jgi:ABC-2 type transport system permease protein
MNIINKAFLKLALLPSSIYNKMGVDQNALAAILNIKLTMDDRRVSGLQQAQRRKSDKEVSSATIITMIVSAVLGLLYLMAFYIGSNVVTSLTFYFFMFFFMLSATLISDFTSVLIDVRDTFIILPKPVNDRTVLLARLLHIFIHICKLVLPMSLPGVIYIGLKYGIVSAIWMIPMLFLLTLLAIFFINAVYIIILRITTPQKFQNVISYFQIVFAIVIYASYQFLPQMMEREGILEFDLTKYPWSAALPMYWMAFAWESLTTFSFTGESVIFLAASIIIPLLCVWIVVKFLAPSFNNKLALINSTSDSQPAAVNNVAQQKRSGLPEKLSTVLTRGSGEAAGFLFAWKMSGRSRDFKLKVYPSMGYMLVLIVVMFARSKKLSFELLASNGMEFKIFMIGCVYLMSLMLVTAISQMVYSEKYKAAWIFNVAPVEYPGEVISGAVKAIVLKFYVPIILLITIPALVIGGWYAVPNLLLGVFNQVLIAALLVYINFRSLPFSRKQNANMNGGSFIRNMGVMVISVFIAIFHYIVYEMFVVVCIFAVLSLIAAWLIAGSIKKTSWAKIKAEQDA